MLFKNWGQKMKRFYFSYAGDCGFGALSSHHLVFESASQETALQTVINKSFDLKGRHFCIVYYKNPPYTVPELLKEMRAGYSSILSVFEIPTFMANWSEDQILDHYKEVDFSGQLTAPENESITQKKFAKIYQWPLKIRECLRKTFRTLSF